MKEQLLNFLKKIKDFIIEKIKNTDFEELINKGSNRKYDIKTVLRIALVTAVLASSCSFLCLYKINTNTSHAYPSMYQTFRDITIGMGRQFAQPDSKTGRLIPSNIPPICKHAEVYANVKETKCDGKIINPINGDFSVLEPDLVFVDDVKLYNSSAPAVMIDDIEEVGYIIYADVNGKTGQSKLWEDVFPFYITLKGKIIPAVNPKALGGGNNAKHFAWNAYYHTSDKNAKKEPFANIAKEVSFQEAACRVGYMKAKNYCKNSKGSIIQIESKCKELGTCGMIPAVVKLF